MKIKRIIILSYCLTSVFTWTTAQVRLSFNLERGTNYACQTEIAQKIKQSAMGMDLPIEETITMDLSMNMKEKNEAVFTWQHISYLLSSPMMKIQYDPKKTIDNPTTIDKIHEKIFNAAIGKTFTASISQEGQVSSLKGIDAISNGATQAVSSDGEMAGTLGASLISQWIGEETVNGLLEQWFRIYPNNEVKVGDQWMIDSDYGFSNKKSTIKNVYTLKSIENDRATITVEATVEMDFEGILKGKQTGELIVDIKTGIPLSSDLNFDIKGTIKQQEMEIQMEMVAKIKTTMKLSLKL